MAPGPPVPSAAPRLGERCWQARGELGKRGDSLGKGFLSKKTMGQAKESPVPCQIWLGDLQSNLQKGKCAPSFERGHSSVRTQQQVLHEVKQEQSFKVLHMKLI